MGFSSERVKRNFFYLYVKYIMSVDRLTEDTPIEGQKWICLSFLSPENVKNCTTRGIKFRGAFATKEEADAYAKQLQQSDPKFNIFVGEGFKWLPFDPEPNTVKDQRYYEKELNELMDAYDKNEAQRRQVEQERKKKKMEEAINESDDQKRKNKIVERLKRRKEEGEIENTPSENPPMSDKLKKMQDVHEMLMTMRK